MNVSIASPVESRATETVISLAPEIALGITRGLSNDDYHAERSAVSSSQLKRMLVSPAHFACPTPPAAASEEALLFGTVLHARLLEPASFGERFFAMPKVNRATKVGKEQAERYAQEAGRRTMFPAEWLLGIDSIVCNAWRHPKVREILSQGEAETAIAWIDPDTGIKCKAKFDWWHRPAVLADVKSARDVTWDRFSKVCAQLHYALSAAMYCEGVLRVTGERPAFAFIACEKEAPHSVVVYRASEDMLARGRRDFRSALRRLAECRALGSFPGLQGDGDWESIDLPRWV